MSVKIERSTWSVPAAGLDSGIEYSEVRFRDHRGMVVAYVCAETEREFDEAMDEFMRDYRKEIVR